jgi:hypothetical protein
MADQDDIEDGIPLITKAEFKARLLAIGMRRAGFCRATMITRQAVLGWGKTRAFPGWVHSWLILAEHTPEVAKMLGALHPPDHIPAPRPPPPIRKKKGAVQVRPEIRTDRNW